MANEPDKRADANFISRWSRRKRAQRVEVAPTPPAGALIEPRGNDKRVDDILTDEQMPPLDSLTEDSDYAGFLSPGVSEGLRKLALRKLFRSATFNIRDGLDDYDDDFRNFAALGDLITSDMKHQLELAQERKRRAEAEAEADTAAPSNETEAEAEAEPDTAAPDDTAPPPDTGNEPP